MSAYHCIVLIDSLNGSSIPNIMLCTGYNFPFSSNIWNTLLRVCWDFTLQTWNYLSHSLNYLVVFTITFITSSPPGISTNRYARCKGILNSSSSNFQSSCCSNSPH
ncbi:hypothetical protein V8G54_011377 [Vigna mungo]|uniref:Uncharacterized protein n=1 Tax=Vigna mungo TaxID=3915 RepID=A0AAQ3NPJ3_VIGMU